MSNNKAQRVAKLVEDAAHGVWTAAEHIRYNKLIPPAEMRELVNIYGKLVALKDRIDTVYYNSIA